MRHTNFQKFSVTRNGWTSRFCGHNLKLVKIFGSIFTILCILFLASGCVTQTTNKDAVPEHWNFGLDLGIWQLGYEADDEEQALREYVLKGQTVTNWTELISSLHLPNPVSPRAMFEVFKFGLLLDCPAAHVSIIKETKDSIVFEWWHEDCGSNPAQDEIRRISATRDGTFTLSFAEKKRQMSPAKRDAWISTINAATIN